MDEQTQSTIVLNERQIEILEWIKDGCPDGVFPADSFAHRVSARALASRGLIRISGRGDAWEAAVTPRGAVWPAATEEDAAVLARQKKVAEVEAKVAAEAGTKLLRATRIPVEQRRRVPVVKEPSKAEQRQRLVDGLTKRLLLEGKPITLMDEKWHYPELDWMLRAAERSPDRPHGKVLSIKTTSYNEEGSHVLSFEPYFRDFVEVVEITVPERVGKYHPAAKEFLEKKDWHPVGKELRPRAARILHAIAKEAERRGIKVLTYSEAEKKRRGNDRGWRGGSWVVFETEHRDYGFEIWEAKGQLNLRQGSPPSLYGSPTFGDRKIVRLEDRLAEAFVRFEIWRLEQAHREEQWRLEAERKQRAWEAAMAQARIDYVEHAKWEHFKELSNTSEKITRHRQFLELAREATRSLPAERQDAAIEYLSEMASVIDSLDPLASPELVLPKLKKPKDSDLEPFLKGWSPYGPDGRR